MESTKVIRRRMRKAIRSVDSLRTDQLCEFIVSYAHVFRELALSTTVFCRPGFSPVEETIYVPSRPDLVYYHLARRLLCRLIRECHTRNRRAIAANRAPPIGLNAVDQGEQLADHAGNHLRLCH